MRPSTERPGMRSVINVTNRTVVINKTSDPPITRSSPELPGMRSVINVTNPTVVINTTSDPPITRSSTEISNTSAIAPSAAPTIVPSAAPTIAPATTPVTTATHKTNTSDSWSLGLDTVSAECRKALLGGKWDLAAEDLLCAEINGTLCEGMQPRDRSKQAGDRSLCLPRVCSGKSDLQSMELSMNTVPMTISCPEYLKTATNVTVSK